MDFIGFINQIKQKLDVAGDKTEFQFSCDDENGIFRAQHPEYQDFFFTAPRGGKMITANWHGHRAQFC